MFRNVLILILSLIILSPMVFGDEQTEIYLSVNFDAKVTFVLEKFKEKLPDKATITYTVVPRGIIVSIAENEFFAPNSTKITENGQVLLREISSVLNDFKNYCTIESHTEEILPQNSIYHENWEISIARAVEITDYITHCCSVEAERLTPIGFGEIMPFKENVSPKGFTNNRIDFVVFDYSASR